MATLTKCGIAGILAAVSRDLPNEAAAAMDEQTLNSRLSRISTIWTMVGEAHGPAEEGPPDARLTLIQRYQSAAYRYLLGAVRDADAADELFQEFALRVMQGAFRRADPGRGRFRDYLKTALIHLVIDHQNRQRNRPRQLDPAVAEPVAPSDDPTSADEGFLRSWREDLLARAWARLEKCEQHGGQPHYSVLRFRADYPEASCSEMAARLSEQLRPAAPFTETGIRKTLQRARAQFADSLLEEVARSLDHPTHDALEQELIDLDLLPYCRSALRRRRPG
jgi:RNA polymerase sigma factor (sigma-70 family)